MSLAATVLSSLRRSFDLYDELAASLQTEPLAQKLPNLPSNTLGQQLWCVVGARESYARGITAGAWSGFACSLTTSTDLAQVRDALTRSRAAAEAAVANLDGFTAAQHQLLCDLVEHEAAHQGQLIRYLYGLKLPIPAGWKARYALD